MPLLALTRAIPASMETCELTHLDRQPIDLELACRQHAAYEDALRSLGVSVERMEELPGHPDSVFVEDTAVILDEVAVITRPGAESRRDETRTTASAVARYRPIRHIEAPGTIDGGDVLTVGRTIFIGISTRSNDEAISQFRAIVAPHGYEVVPVKVGGVLHLKSAVTQVGASQLLVNRELVDVTPFAGFELIDVAPGEPGAANALLVDGTVFFPTAFPQTRTRLEQQGIRPIPVEASEVAKAEGALTCCSLLLRQ